MFRDSALMFMFSHRRRRRRRRRRRTAHTPRRRHPSQHLPCDDRDPHPHSGVTLHACKQLFTRVRINSRWRN
jgi:hypothetical protein